ncbi:cbb3-type cytochrome oxidase assembly protein CcoS [Leeia sp.]|uniref:cbb3-type cytochrome oxidase assembly protein CcoS n=1 Tax=Leeia sp. TaxID=2884678 RepID=UPI0035AEEBAC
MDIVYLLIPLSLLAVLAIGALFWWAIKSGQFDDLDGPAYQVVMDEDRHQAMPADTGPRHQPHDAC